MVVGAMILFIRNEPTYLTGIDNDRHILVTAINSYIVRERLEPTIQSLQQYGLLRIWNFHGWQRILANQRRDYRTTIFVRCQSNMKHLAWSCTVVVIPKHSSRVLPPKCSCGDHLRPLSLTRRRALPKPLQVHIASQSAFVYDDTGDEE